MGWNYRVLAHKDGDEMYFMMHEVYYNKDGIPNSYTANGVGLGSNSIEGLEWGLDKMKEALSKPILSIENFPEEYKQDDNKV